MAAFNKGLCLCMCLLACWTTWGQTNGAISTDLRELEGRSAHPGWMRLGPAPLPFSKVDDWAAPILGLGDNVDLRLHALETDAHGISHGQYQQEINGIPIVGARISLYGYNKQAQWAHGHAISALSIETRPALQAPVALKYFLQAYPHVIPAWIDPALEAALRMDMGDSSATYYPEGQLVILPLRLFQTPSYGYALAWAFDIKLQQPDDKWRIWIDAQKGTILGARSMMRACTAHRGTFESLHYQMRGFDVRKGQHLGNDYVLKDCRGEGIHTKYHRLDRFGETGSWGWSSNVRGQGVDWGRTNQEATSAHWAAQVAWDYFEDNFNWQGPHNQGLPLRIWADWKASDGSFMPNAQYVFDQKRHYLYLGRYQGASLATLDIVGHEFAHGIIEHTADLAYEGESGALHESFADILGTLVERSLLDDAFDWEIGAEIGGLRSLESPHTYLQPRQYGPADAFWAEEKGTCLPQPQNPTGLNFDCTVHTNSGVQNRWFYLLSEGGIQSQTTVYGIGTDAAAQIVFRSLTHYLLPYDTYADARLASIQAAADMYGECSNELAQVKNAWAAVGVGMPNFAICADILGAEDICQDEPLKELTYEARAVAGASFEWSPLPIDWAYYISGTQNQYITLTYIPQDAIPLLLEAEASLGGQFAKVQKPVALVECKTDTSINGPGEGNSTRLKFPEVRLIPNPCRDQVMVYLPEGRYPAQVSLFDMGGRLLRSGTATQSEWTFDMASLAIGTYLIQVQGPNRVSHHRVLRLR